MRVEFSDSEIRTILFVIFACFMGMVIARACKVEREHTFRMRQLELVRESNLEGARK